MQVILGQVIVTSLANIRKMKIRGKMKKGNSSNAALTCPKSITILFKTSSRTKLRNCSRLEETQET